MLVYSTQLTIAFRTLVSNVSRTGKIYRFHAQQNRVLQRILLQQQKNCTIVSTGRTTRQERKWKEKSSQSKRSIDKHLKPGLQQVTNEEEFICPQPLLLYKSSSPLHLQQEEAVLHQCNNILCLKDKQFICLYSTSLLLAKLYPFTFVQAIQLQASPGNDTTVSNADTIVLLILKMQHWKIHLMGNWIFPQRQRLIRTI